MKNIYTIDEIDFIFKECNCVNEIFVICEIFKLDRQLGLFTDENSKVIGQLSLLRFRELIAKKT